MPPHKLFLLIEKSIELELSNPTWEREREEREREREWEPKGRASGSQIDPEVLPYLTGAINSSIMMLTIAQVTRRTRRGHAACSGSPFSPGSRLSAELTSKLHPGWRKKKKKEEKFCFCNPSHLSQSVCLVSFNQEHFIYIMSGSFHKFIFI